MNMHCSTITVTDDEHADIYKWNPLFSQINITDTSYNSMNMPIGHATHK